MKKSHKFMTSMALAAGLAIPVFAGEAAPSDELAQIRADVKSMFGRFDRNEDGMITRAEYRGTAVAFDRFDLNYDGLISPTEVEETMLHPKPPADRLHNQDADEDGVISRAEFSGDDASFARLDRNHDGVLSDADKRPARVAGAGAEGRFKAMDTNSDGQLTRDEWRGTDRTFQAKDANGDGVLTLNEVKPEKKEQ